MGTASTLGDTGGAIDHTHTVAAHTHPISSDGNHSHTVDAHTHNINVDGGHSHGISADGSHSHSGSTGSEGDHSHSVPTTDTTGSVLDVDTNYDGIVGSFATAGHTHGVNDTGNAGAHSHTISSDGSHSHGGSTGSVADHDHGGNTDPASPGTNTTGAHDHGAATGLSGGVNTGTANPPFVTINFIILTGV